MLRWIDGWMGGWWMDGWLDRSIDAYLNVGNILSNLPIIS